VLELQASGRLVGCRISDSRTVGDLVQWWSPARSMERCELLGNIANNGVYAGNGPLSIVGCLVIGNRFEASGIAHWDGGFVLSQCTPASSAAASVAGTDHTPAQRCTASIPASARRSVRTGRRARWTTTSGSWPGRRV
jgi:hypothetical protein